MNTLARTAGSGPRVYLTERSGLPGEMANSPREGPGAKISSCFLPKCRDGQGFCWQRDPQHCSPALCTVTSWDHRVWGSRPMGVYGQMELSPGHGEGDRRGWKHLERLSRHKACGDKAQSH